VNLLFVTPGSVEALPALALVVRHRAEPAVLAVGGARAVAAVWSAEPVRAGAHVVTNAEAAVFTFRGTRN